MRKAKKWFKETSFWQIFITYSVGSWVVLGHVDLLTDWFGVPDWVFNLSLALSLLGLIGIVWASLESLRTAYQQADSETILKVVLEAGELREVR